MSTPNRVIVKISFSASWILTKRGTEVLPTEWLSAEIQNHYAVIKINTKLTECNALLEISDSAALESISDQIREMICSYYQISGDEPFSIELHEAEIEESAETDAPEKSDAPEKTDSAEQHTPAGSNADAADALQSIHDLVGANEFKELADEINLIAERLIEHDMTDAFTCRSYIVSVNDGYGLTTYLELFADLIERLKLFSFHTKTRVAEVKLAPPDLNQDMESAFAAALACFQRRDNGKVVCIDISEWMSKLTDKQFREFLKQVDEHGGENIVFFRIPFVEKSIVRNVETTLNDVLFIKSFSIPPFHGDELMQCAEALLSQKNFALDDNAWDIFHMRIASEKSDGKFYGINTIRKVIREMLYIKQLYNVHNNLNDRTIRREEILDLVQLDCTNSKNGFEQLADLIGMETVADKVKEIVAQIEAALQNDSIDTPCIHMRFIRNPGTGKTTVARILGLILKERGILRNGSFFEHSGRDLCGKFVGETAPKTAAICRDAYGSVLFIDEAYSLYRDDSISNADYGREAIDTLVAEMENHRTDLMVIMAGYPDDMEKLMNGNIGLKSRMPYLIEFSNYTRQQLAEIFMSMVNKGFRYDDAFSDAVSGYFDALSDQILQAKDFSNARFVRNLFERTWGKAALRCQLNQTACDTLTVEDFALATADKEFHNIMEHKKKAIGFQ